MSRQICNFDHMMLCVNNYRGEDYNKPEESVDCNFCLFNPDNKGLKEDPSDSDKVVFNDKDFRNLELFKMAANLVMKEDKKLLEELGKN